MDSEQLRYFVSAAQSLNFSEAARRHFISQPAISHHISSLEKELGVELFLRIGRQVRLTSEGSLFLQEAVEMLQHMDRSFSLVRQHHEGQSGKVTVCMVNTSNGALSKCLSVFCKRYGDIQVDVTVASGIMQSTSLAEGRYDIFLTILPMVVGHDYVDYTISHCDRFCLAVPGDSPLAEGPADFARLAGMPFSIVSFVDAPLLHTQIMGICAERAYAPRIVSSYNRMEAVLLSVSAGVSVAMLPASLCDLCPDKSVAFLPIPGDDALLPSVVAWKRSETNASALKFRDVALELFPRDAGESPAEEGAQ